MQHTAHHAHSPHRGGLHLYTAGFAEPRRVVMLLGIDHGSKVADFGSGSGAYAIAIAKHLAHSGHVYAIDVQRDLLKRTHNEAARLGLKNISTIWADLEHPGRSKIADHQIDMVLASNMLFQIEHKSAVFEEAHRILKRNGRLVVIDWSDSFNGMGPPAKDVVKKGDVLKIAYDCGFELSGEFEPGAHHWGLIFQKK